MLNQHSRRALLRVLVPNSIEPESETIRCLDLIWGTGQTGIGDGFEKRATQVEHRVLIVLQLYISPSLRGSLINIALFILNLVILASIYLRIHIK